MKNRKEKQTIRPKANKQIWAEALKLHRDSELLKENRMADEEIQKLRNKIAEHDKKYKELSKGPADRSKERVDALNALLERNATIQHYRDKVAYYDAVTIQLDHLKKEISILEHNLAAWNVTYALFVDRFTAAEERINAPLDIIKQILEHIYGMDESTIIENVGLTDSVIFHFNGREFDINKQMMAVDRFTLWDDGR